MALEPLDRYSRQIRFPQLGEQGQQALINSRVTLCGCGALGTVLANHLARAGVGSIRIVDRDFIEDYTGAYQVGHYPTLLGTNHDFLATRVSYKLNLKGPSFTLQCGCSTSLVAVCQACQGLMSFQSDMALAGGVSITFPQKRGYHYQDGGMGSRD